MTGAKNPTTLSVICSSLKTVTAPAAPSLKNAPLCGETNATASFLISATEIILFANDCVVSFV